MSTTDLPSHLAQLVGLFVECLFYGIYLVTFAACIRTIVWSGPELRWRSRFKNHWSMLAVVLLLFVCSSLNLSLGLLRIFQAFLCSVGSDYVEDFGQDWISIVKVIQMPFVLSLEGSSLSTALLRQSRDNYRWWCTGTPYITHRGKCNKFI